MGDEYNKALDTLNRYGCYVENLWCVDDVDNKLDERFQHMYSEADKMDILAEAINHPSVYELINERIQIVINKNK
jgi:hypothetical protein